MRTYSGMAVIGIIGVAAALVLSVSPAWGADEEAPQGQYKIGVVNLKEVFDGYELQKSEYAKLKTDRDQRQTELDAIENKVNSLKSKYDAEKDKMSETQRTELEETINAERLRWQSEFKRMQSEIDLKEKNLLTRLMDNIHTAVQELGTKENYHLILEAGEAGRSGVLYSSSTLNITPKVIVYLNNMPADQNAGKKAEAKPAKADDGKKQ